MKKMALIAAAMLAVAFMTGISIFTGSAAAADIEVFDPLYPQDIVITTAPDYSGTPMLGGVPLSDYQYTLHGGTLTLPASYLYSLMPGLYTVSADRDILLQINDSGYDLKEAFAISGGNWKVFTAEGMEVGGMQVEFTADVLTTTIFDGSKFISSSNIEILGTHNTYQASVRLPDYYESNGLSMVLRAELEPGILYSVSIDTNHKNSLVGDVYLQSDKSSGILRLGNETFGCYTNPSVEFTASGKYLYVVLKHELNNTSQINIDIAPVFNDISFYLDGEPICTQHIPHGKAAFAVHIPSANEWFTDIEMTQLYNFDTPVTADIQLYSLANQADVTIPDAYLDIDKNTLKIIIDEDNADKYQYWIQSTVFNSKGEQNPSWYRLSGFTDKSFLTFDKEQCYLIDGHYNIIVRAMEDDAIKWERLYRFNAGDFGDVVISYADIDGQPLSLNGTNLVCSDSIITVNAKNANGCELYIDGKYGQYSADGAFDLARAADEGFLAGGMHRVQIVAYGQNSLTDTISFQMFFTHDFNSSEALTAYDLTEHSSDGAGGVVFCATVRYAGGGEISQSALYGITPLLKIGGTAYFLYTTENCADESMLKLLFSVSLPGTGIFLATFELSGLPGGQTDYFSYYYCGYRASGTCYVAQAPDKTSAALGATFNITASGEVGGSADDTVFAFYKEDAAGYTLLQWYDSGKDTLSWTPAHTGTYRIITRIMGKDSASYEAECCGIFTVTDSHGILSGDNISLDVYGHLAEAPITVQTGKAYKITASYNGTTDILYKFLVRASHTPGIYLTRYSLSGELVFFFYKPGTYVFTVRIIDWNRYGYSDVSLSIEVNASA